MSTTHPSGDQWVAGINAYRDREDQLIDGNTAVTIETEDGTTTGTYHNGPWTTMHYLADQWEARGWRYSIRHHDQAITLTLYNDDGTIDRHITLTEETT